MSVIARLLENGQTTVPEEIRLALHVEPGDLIQWSVTGEGRAEIRRVPSRDLDYLKAIEAGFSEWTSKEDEEAYRDL